MVFEALFLAKTGYKLDLHWQVGLAHAKFGKSDLQKCDMCKSDLPTQKRLKMVLDHVKTCFSMFLTRKTSF